METEKRIPDILDCIANLSNDEVFTSPALANKMLDLLPQDLFRSPDTRFLDPCCKSGVFLREITRRLIKGLETTILDRQERIDHILTTQVFGLAITELTSYLSRRSLYCSRYADGRYSICDKFSDDQGEIRYERLHHSWAEGKCRFCGASQAVYDRGEDAEQYAYQFIHTTDPKTIFNMQFDVIIGNPPYQLSDGGGMVSDTASGSAIPLYNRFVIKAQSLNPRFLVMIIPSRWFSGGRGLDDFRVKMLNDHHIKELVDFPDSRDCFPGVDIAGGVCYFLWDSQYSGKCKTSNFQGQSISSAERYLDEFPVFIRYVCAVDIIRKVQSKNERIMSDYVYSSKPFGLRSFEEGEKKKFNGAIGLFGSRGITFVHNGDVKNNQSLVGRWKVIISKTSAEHAGQADKDGKKKIISRVIGDTCKLPWHNVT